MHLRKIGFIVFITFIFSMVWIPHGFCADVAKIGIINFQKIFDNSNAGKTAKKEINKEGQRMEAELKKHGDEIKKLKETLERDQSVMSKDANDEKKWQLNRKLDDAKALKRKYDRKIQELQMRLVNSVRKDVLQLVKDYGKKHGFLLILEDINTVYAPPSLDVTDQIIKIYNENPPKKK
ncbi:MAG: OmpH family outer membrane protein [Desulfobacteraceae bacterium]|nr:OmpH family outer membrane protein [Desulfobacteraceae bacterium]